MSSYRYLFGPVHSRRLGRSLGVDLVPLKTCSYNCIYCQLGKTPTTTVLRKHYHPVSQIIQEVSTFLDTGIATDVITLSGSGEPTLHEAIGDIISDIKRITNIPVVVLTNSSLFGQSAVHDASLEADIVIPSLDAGDVSLFQYVNRPHPSIDFDEMVGGLTAFSHHFKGKIWLEVLLVSGVTTPQKDVKNLAALIAKMNIEKVQLNSVTRPPAESFAHKVSTPVLEKLIPLFSVPTHIVEDASAPCEWDSSSLNTNEQDLLALLERRPCTSEEIAQTLKTHPIQILKTLDMLQLQNKISTQQINDNVYYYSREFSR